jgi:hypothetical protein
MEASDTRVVEPPDDQLIAVREWLWRHSSQPNGDPWDGDPEHLDRATRNLNDLIQSFLATHPSTSAAECTDTSPPATFQSRDRQLLSSAGIGK